MGAEPSGQRAGGRHGAADRKALETLRHGAVTLRGRLPRASNATFLVEVAPPGAPPPAAGARGTDALRPSVEGGVLAVYKPEAGERPLWDFPPGLYRREIAAWMLSEALGWRLVPPTVAREGPHGPGSLQLFVEADFRQHYFTLREEAAHRDALRRLCAFDLIANNADRKSGHCLLGGDGRIHAIDNGLCFNAEPKLRTVIWDFAGQRLPRGIRDDLAALLAAGPPAALADLLDPDERDALLARVRALLEAGRFPTDDGGWRYPWPLV